MKRVAVIGFGSAGVAAARELLAERPFHLAASSASSSSSSSSAGGAGPSAPNVDSSSSSTQAPQLHEYAVTVFERRPRAGGIWQHDAHPPPCKLRFDDDGAAAVTWASAAAAGEDTHMSVDEEAELERKVRPPGPMYEDLRTNIAIVSSSRARHPEMSLVI